MHALHAPTGWLMLILGACNVPAISECFMDEDGDGYGSQVRAQDCGEQTANNANDCKDDDPAVGPPEVLFVDGDGDGFGVGLPLEEKACVSDGYALVDGDCNDADRAALPGGVEVCADRLDNDCNGEVDDADLDGDGFVDLACAQTHTGPKPATDCDDDNPQIHPQAPELADGLDNDCDACTPLDSSPPAVTCATELGGLCVLPADINASVTLDAGRTYLLQDEVRVTGSGTHLLIDAGVTILADQDGALIVDQDNQIFACGTSTEPILFTANEDPDDRTWGSWVGLVLNGRGPTHPAYKDLGPAGPWGGGDPKDSSGTLRYVKVHYAGGTWRNGVTLRGVGSETTIDYLSVHRSLGDGIHVSGGTVFLTHTLVTGAEKSGLFWNYGWRGGGQYMVLHAYEDSVQPEQDGAQGRNDLSNWFSKPVSRPYISNALFVTSESTRTGLFLLSGSHLHLSHSLFVGGADACLVVLEPSLNHVESFDEVRLEEVYLACDRDFDLTTKAGQTLKKIFGRLGSGGQGDDGDLVDAFSEHEPDYVSSLTSRFQPLADPRVEPTLVVGAMAPGGDWATSWAYPLPQ